MSELPAEPVEIQQRRLGMTRALQSLDSEAEVQVDRETGRLMVLTSLPAEKVVAILEGIGERIEIEQGSEDGCGDSFGSNCCGGCSH